MKELKDLPQSSVGAPMPLLVATDNTLAIAYLVEAPELGQPGWPRVPDDHDDRERGARISFTGSLAHFFGPPNDEALSGRPLAKRGLGPYGAYEVLRSSWIRALERMNAVHPLHQPDRFATYRHFILTFHDSTFECVAKGYRCELGFAPLQEMLFRPASST